MLHAPLVKSSENDPYHLNFKEFISIGNQIPSPSILEIGSRNVTGATRKNAFSHYGEYVGFDILPGEGVDLVGDVHALSRHCPPEHFDLVYSISVFEHLLFPWKAVLEINKVMKPGGHVFIATHTVWPAHELPWDFWRYPANGFRALFNGHTGFEIVRLSEGLPCRAYSLVSDAPTRRLWCYTMSLGVSLIARKIGNYRSDLLKWDIEVSDTVDSMYPDNPPRPVGAPRRDAPA